MIPVGKTKHKTIIINRSVFIIREMLEAYMNYYCDTPEEIQEKIQEIINIIDDKYMPMPEHENDIELFDSIYKITYKYAEYLE